MSDADESGGIDDRPICDGELDALFAPLGHYANLVLAVSGGSDSIALMQLAADWAGRLPAGRPEVVVVTVDHRLRTESSDEARWVAGEAGRRGLTHRTLTWTGPKPHAQVQAAAREARYALLYELAAALPRSAIVTAHHANDQAETLLMRLARGSGLDGLAAIPRRRMMHGAAAGAGVPVERPLLAISKRRLVATLRARGAVWLEDPSNANESFERVRWRKALPTLARHGLTVTAVARSARRLARARAALDLFADAAWQRIVKTHDGAYGAIARCAWEAEPEEIQIRTLMRAFAAFGGESEGVQLSQAEAARERLASAVPCRFTLGGCLIEGDGRAIRVFREVGRRPLPRLRLEPGEEGVWDRRFAVGTFPRCAASLDVRALGDDGVALLLHRGGAVGGAVDHGMSGPCAGGDLVGWLAALPRTAVCGLPSFWTGGRLVCVPYLRWDAAVADAGTVGWARFMGLEATQK